MSRSMLIAPPSSRGPHVQSTPTPSRTHSVFPVGGVFSAAHQNSNHAQQQQQQAMMQRAPISMHPPRTPIQPMHQSHQPIFNTPAMQTPMKPQPHTPAVPNGFQTPQHHHHHSVAAPSPSPNTPAVATPSTASALSTMSEAETAKLMQALNGFVLIALQQQSSAYTTAMQTGRVTEAEKYQTLLSQLQAQHTDPLALSRWYAALSKSVSSLHAQHHADLLQLLYTFSYTDAASLRNVEALINLLVAMCVGGNQIQAIQPVLKTMVNSFIATNVPFSTITAVSVSPALYGRPGDGTVPSLALGETAAPHLAPPPQVTSGGHQLPTMDSIHDIVHSALTRLMQLLPSSPTVLFPILVESFPHKSLDVTIQLVYVKNLLRVSEYAGSLRDRILTTIIERMIHIDVEIVHQVDGENEEDDGDELDDMNGEDEHGAPFVEPDLIFSMSGGADQQQQPPKRLTESHIMANKLDSLMCLMFEYLNLIRIAGTEASLKGNKSTLQTPQTPGTLIANATNTNGSNALSNASSSNSSSSTSSADLCDEVFSSLLRVFERSILRTHNSRFLQYLLFYYCSFKHVYAETFLKYLMERGFEVSTSGVERQNTALYIASFVARASFLRHASAIVAFEMLLKWTHAYTEYHIKTSQAALLAQLQNSYTTTKHNSSSLPQVPEVGPLEASQHSVFYRMCLAVFYIFCYRQDSFRDMLAENPDILKALKFDALIFSPLNPLRFISQNVIDEFLRVNAQLGYIVQCEELVQRNHRLNQASRIGGNNQGNNQKNSKHSSRHPHSNSNHQASSNGDSSGILLGSDGSSSNSLNNASRFDPNDIFFPFDPYQLKHSSAYIENLYITYQQEEDEEEQEEEEEDDDGESQMDDDDNSSASRPIRIGITRPVPSTSTGASTRSPELDASVSSMSQSFSDRLSVDGGSNNPSAHATPLGSSMSPGGAAMSFEMERAHPLLKLPPPSFGNKSSSSSSNSSSKRSSKDQKKNKKSKKKSRNAMASSSDEDDSDDSDDDDAGKLTLGEQDFSFSPNSPMFSALSNSPPMKGKRK